MIGSIIPNVFLMSLGLVVFGCFLSFGGIMYLDYQRKLYRAACIILGSLCVLGGLTWWPLWGLSGGMTPDQYPATLH